MTMCQEGREDSRGQFISFCPSQTRYLLEFPETSVKNRYGSPFPRGTCVREEALAFLTRHGHRGEVQEGSTVLAEHVTLQRGECANFRVCQVLAGGGLAKSVQSARKLTLRHMPGYHV